ncbi:hypothetical protein H671_4g12609, partial [Cricetulus griseus]
GTALGSYGNIISSKLTELKEKRLALYTASCSFLALKLKVYPFTQKRESNLCYRCKSTKSLQLFVTRQGSDYCEQHQLKLCQVSTTVSSPASFRETGTRLQDETAGCLSCQLAKNQVSSTAQRPSEQEEGTPNGMLLVPWWRLGCPICAALFFSPPSLSTLLVDWSFGTVPFLLEKKLPEECGTS